MITQETIARILDAARIEEVIGDFVYLKKAGSSYKGLSPFKQEKTPSFVVSPAKQIFKCFSTGKGGNVFSFLMEHEQMNYPEALRYVANKYNIEIEEEKQSDEQIEAQSRRESLSVIMKFANQFFQDQLHHTDTGKSVALSYLKKRGLTDDIIQEFGLGWCPESGDALIKAAEAKGHNPQFLEDLGLVKNYGTRRRDFYAGRVIFPISSVSGNSLAFAGRTLHKDTKAPKYINSPETELYYKSKVLYAMHQARSAVAKENLCYLTEGYTDVIAMHQAGVKNVVATSGTALTKEQAYLVKRYTNNVCLMYDGDGAGVKAALRGIDILLEEGLTVYVLNLPNDHDPDSFAKEKGPEGLKDYLEHNKKDFVAYKAELYLKGVSDPIKRAEGIREIVKSVALVEDAILREIYVKQCASDYNLDQATLLQEVAKLKRNNFIKTKEPAARKPQEQDFADHDPFLPTDAVIEVSAKSAQNPLTPLESELLRLLLVYGQKDFILKVNNEEDNTVEETEHNVSEFILEILDAEEIQFSQPQHNQLLDLFRQNPNIGQTEIMAAVNPEALQEISSWLYVPHEISDRWEKDHEIKTAHEADKLSKVIPETIYAYLLQTIRLEIAKNEEKMKHEEDFEKIKKLLSLQKRFINAKKVYSNILHRVILH